MKKILQFKLKILASLILKKYKPEVIGITGSVGKTSAKEAIFAILSTNFKVRRNIKNYNNEIGLPLTIIGVDSPGRSIFGWFNVFFKAIKLILFRDKNYPDILILEMGVDRPGDMNYLLSIVTPNIGVVTRIGPTHLEYFESIEHIQKEKGGLIGNLQKGGWAILNYDDELVRKISDRSKVKVITYGFEKGAQVRAEEIRFSFENKEEAANLLGISFKLSYNGSFVPVLLPNVISFASVYAALAGASIGVAYGINLLKISQALKSYQSPRGRMNLVEGEKGTLIIDDTYNSSPQSTMSALDLVCKIKVNNGGQKFAVLGDMLELGSYSEEGHREVGRYAVESRINVLVTVGERARDIYRGAEEAGMSRDFIFQFSNSEEAGKFIEKRMKKNDLILVKGSQGMRMEKIVKEIMGDPLRAKELLVRQDKEWENK
ncbi:MAG: Mur ligase family protein [Patescibacteria group bacterium]|nr:Mur ligase family protein [Patescibacteria group bacterium]MDD4610948.1 Mur ligase family protein [Patescibacteria group bacterium]